MPRLSLTARLTLFFTVFAALVMLGLGWLFMVAADHHFIELDRRALADKQELVGHLLRDAAGPEAARRALTQTLDHQQAVRVVVRSNEGGVLFRSVSSGQPDAHAEHAAMAAHALRFELAPGYAPTTRLEVTLTVDTAFHEQFLHELRGTLAWYALAATVLAGLLGWLAAHQGLAPLRAMKTRAADVSAQRLDPRMPEQAVPVEMADLAAELNRMLVRLRDDFRRLSEFSSDLAHELRTPISNLLTQTQVTLSARRDTDTYREILASNAEELERLARMVSDMLFLAKTERGVDLPGRERFDLAAETRAVAEFHEAVAEERGLRITVQGEAFLHGDRLMLRRAVGNLLSNALRHAREGSEVAIRIHADAGRVELVVENVGEPIPMELQVRLFDRFFSADPARSHPASEGTGLGLAITRAIVEAHGGEVGVQSDAEATRFVLRFPLAARQ